MSLAPDDASDDAFADRDEDPRADLGYTTTTAPRLRKPQQGAGHFAVVWVSGEATDAGPIGGVHRCRDRSAGGCGEEAPVLHADPRSTSPARVLCSRCTGAAMRDRIGWAQAKAPEEKRR